MSKSAQATKEFRYRKASQRPPRRWLVPVVLVVAALLAGGAYLYNRHQTPAKPVVATATPSPRAVRQAGRVLSVVSVQSFTPAQALAEVKQNYGSSAPVVTTGVTKVTFTYSSQDPDGQPLVIYGRAYLPTQSSAKLPIFAFAPGTTGIGDACAPSLEQPAVANWANYDSHMITYASQGYAAVTTDYEGMRDPSRLHHYMVGELEGRAVLDSVRGLENLTQAKNRLDTHNIFLGGYSQGGHAAFWADKIDAAYAPDIAVKGVVGWGPVMSVKETLADVTHAANLNWFGPYVLTSLSDYYHHTYPVDQILLPQWTANLTQDVTAHCIDSDISFWGSNPAKVYQPAFIQAMQSGVYDGPFAQFAADMDANAVGGVATSSAKLINEGANDNVVLPAQQQAELPQMCAASHGPVQLHVYPGTTHYDNMVHSFKDTLNWMDALRAGRPVPTSCTTATPTP